MAGGIGRKILRRAVDDTLHTFDTNLLRVLVGVVLAVLGLLLRRLFQGPAEMMSEVWGYVIAIIGPNLLFGAVVFAYQLWAAPYKMAIDAVAEAKTFISSIPSPAPATLRTPAPKPYDFTPIQIRDSLNGHELGAVLAAIKAGGNRGEDASRLGYENAVLEAMKSHTLKLLPEYWEGPMGNYPAPIAISRKITKASAIAWGESKGFDMSPIK